VASPEVRNFQHLERRNGGKTIDGQKDNALQTAIRALKIRPTWLPTLETLALCYATLDRVQEARECIEQMRKLEKPKGDLLALLKNHNPQWTETMAAMLGKVGWQE
jgi:hypothetical protein